MRKVLSLLLTLVLVSTVIVGCSKENGNEVNNSSNSDSNVGTTKPTEGANETVEEPYTVAIQLVNIARDLSDIEMVEEAINEITVPAINAKVDIQNIFIGDLPSTTSMNIVSDGKMDIVAVGLTQKLNNISNDGILLPLDDYLQYAPTFVSLVDDYLETGKVNGQQLAIPATPYVANGKGFAYNKDMADQYGIVLEDGATFEEFTKAFKILKENGIYGLTNGAAGSLNTQFWYNLELYGTNGDYGVIVDPVNNTTIENFYASDIFREFVKQMKEWTDLGYMPADSLTDTTTVQEYFSMGRIFGTPTDYNMAQFATWQAGKDFAIDIVQIQEPVVSTSSVVERMWGIASNSENPKKAMEFLEYMYVNPAVANLLQYGIEGQNYTIVEGTKSVTTSEGAVTGSTGYTSLFTQYGNTVETYTAAPNTDSYSEDVMAYNKDVPVSATLGYNFDSTEYSAEAGMVSNVIAEYLPRFQTGQIDNVDESIQKFLDALDRAGYNDIIKANQEQLDAFLAQ
jgi:putative aldouronate transport system substrate-binding protein